MELIRCDHCGNEIRAVSRYYELELRGQLRKMGDLVGVVHFCSESCGAAWFAVRAPEVAEEDA